MGKSSNLVISLPELSLTPASQGCSLYFRSPNAPMLPSPPSVHMLCLCCSVRALPSLHLADSYLPPMSHFAFIKNNCLFILFLAMLGLLCCTGFSLVAELRDFSPVAVSRLLIAAASLVAEHGLQSTWAL